MPKKIQKKKKNKTEPQVQETRPKDFLDLIAPAAVKFNTDHYICGSLYHCTLALRSYPATTEELALLRHLGEKSGVTLSIYTRQVTAAEENGILHNAENKNRMARSSTNSMKAAVTAEGNLQDVAELIAAMRKNREPLVHCAVYIDLAARDPESDEEFVIFDGGRHGYDNMFCDEHDPSELEHRPLKRYEIPASKLGLALGYSIDYEDEKEDFEPDEAGTVELINGERMPWEQVKRDGIDYIALYYVNEKGKPVQILDAELA